MRNWLRCCVEWCHWIGMRHEFGRFGPIHAWQMARCFHPTAKEQARRDRDVAEAIAWARRVRRCR